ncbi:MAG: sterol desaturase family protein [Deltaproteobacteria bacterium]|nr:sterol desaturase family protein [Deltaproteobacteria bacterium]
MVSLPAYPILPALSGENEAYNGLTPKNARIFSAKQWPAQGQYNFCDLELTSWIETHEPHLRRGAKAQFYISTQTNSTWETQNQDAAASLLENSAAFASLRWNEHHLSAPKISQSLYDYEMKLAALRSTLDPELKVFFEDFVGKDFVRKSIKQHGIELTAKLLDPLIRHLNEWYRDYKTATATYRHHLLTTPEGQIKSRIIQYSAWPLAVISAIQFAAAGPAIFKHILPDNLPVAHDFATFVLTSLTIVTFAFTSITFLENIMPKDVRKLKADWMNSKFDFLHNVVSAGVSSEVIKLGLIAAGSGIGKILKDQFGFGFNAWNIAMGSSQSIFNSAIEYINNIDPLASTAFTLMCFAALPIAKGLLTLIPVETAVYPIHRWEHKSPLGWILHKVHHLPRLMRGTRAGWETPFVGPFKVALGFAIAALLGVPPEVLLIASSWVATNGIYQHTLARTGVDLAERQAWLQSMQNEIETLPEQLKNSWENFYNEFDKWWCGANSHGVGHHALDPRFYDKNMSNTFGGYDILFGTFLMPEDDLPVGIDEDLGKAYKEHALVLHTEARKALAQTLPAYATRLTQEKTKRAFRIAKILLVMYPKLLGEEAYAALTAMVESMQAEKAKMS